MPSLSRRREIDGRAERFESEVRESHMKDPAFPGKRKYTCGNCKRLFEERSRNCPRCDSRTMFEMKQIPERHVEEARRNAERRARARIGR